MKHSLVTLLIIVALSLAIWAFFFFAPGPPLEQEETLFVVLTTSIVVAGVRAIWRYFQKKRTDSQ